MIQTTNAVILRSTIFRETSQLLTFLTQDFGKIHTLAKGVRRKPSRFGSTFGLFTCNRIVFYERSRTDLQLLSQCDLIDSFPSIRADLKKTAYAAYFTELVDRATEPGDRSGRMYRLVLEGLRELSQTEFLEEAARLFEVKLLAVSGLLPELTHCQQCGGEGKAPFSLSLRGGGVLCGRCLNGHNSSETLSLSRGSLIYLQRMASSPWGPADRIRLSQSCGLELKEILKRFIDFHLEEKIYSRDFLEELEAI